MFNVSKSGYYRSRKKKDDKDILIRQELFKAHTSFPSYGIDRLWAEVKEKVICGRNRLRRIMKEMHISSCRKNKLRIITTDSKHDLPVYDNLINQNFKADKPNQIWASDISYIPTSEGFLYLAIVKDVFTKEIVGYSTSCRITKELVIAALHQALAKTGEVKGLIHCSDRGSQYCSRAYQKLLKFNNIKGSMSRKGNPYDNAPAESFFSTIKCELTHLKKYRTRKEAELSIFEYIESFYNRRRRHSGLGYLSPRDFKEKYYSGAIKSNVAI